MNPLRVRNRTSGSMAAWAFFLVAFASVAGAFYVLRYRGLWIDQDTSLMTVLIENVRREGTLSPSAGKAYGFGYAYQAVTAFILEVAGLSVQQLQVIIWPLVAAPALALTAFSFFDQAARDRRTAALAALLLFFQGDLVFTILRGSHEKLDWPLMMVALMLLIRGSSRAYPGLLRHVFLFYLTVFAMMATNIFFASTLVVAIVLSLFLGVLVEVLLHRRLAVAGDLRRLLWVALSCIALLFIVAAYLYSPALATLRQISGITEQIRTAMFGLTTTTGSPYEYVAYSWISGGVYLGLTLFTWLLIAGSFVEWLSWGRAILKREKTAGIRENLVWLLYAAFAIQVAVGVLVDFSGVLGQNLQLRIFPGFTVMAVVLLAHLIRRLLAAREGNHRRRFVQVAATAVLFAWFSIAAILKATNEPALSNMWVFYAVPEAKAVDWADGKLQGAYIWTGHDERLYEAGSFQRAGSPPNSNTFGGYRFQGYENYVLFSERERVRGLRMGLAMPSVLEWHRVYDNGDVRLFHKRPQTRYQR